MSSRKYFINTGNQNIGPYDFEKINDLIKQNQLKASDRLYLDDQDKWIMISEHPEFKKQKLVSVATTIEPVAPKKLVIEQTSGQWFALRGQERQGPFEYSDIVRLLQEKVLFEYDFVWTPGMESWSRIAEVDSFSPESIRQHMKADKDIFVRRKHMRLMYECPLVAHDNKGFWGGYTIELSEGGAGVAIENALLMPGQSIYLHFKPGSHTKPFNVLCEVVSKKYIKNVKIKDTAMVYGVKFINIPKQEKELIRALSAQAA